ncbi:MAG: mannosyltransferase, partial [Bacteroidetes bacterium]|nr:mannosyltransferase [Bacteroidota bacterium]
MEQHLHIVSFDIPYPPDYGGVIDVYYKIKTLSEAGVKIHLHCFE